MLVWNVFGLSELPAALHDTWQYITQFDIVMLTETQALAPLQRQLPQHAVFTIPATAPGRRGEGILLAIRRQLPFSVLGWQLDADNGVIWVTMRPSHSQHSPLTIGVVYVPPASHHSAQLARKPAQARFDALSERLTTASCQGQVLLAGDCNARVGSLHELWLPDLGHSVPAQAANTDQTINSHGRKLQRLCADSAVVLCTGRTPSDVPAAASFKARSNTSPSRLDHVLVDPSLFAAIQSCGIGAERPDSDHLPLEAHLLLHSTPSTTVLPAPALVPAPKWIWDSAKRDAYAGALQTEPC